MSRICRRYIFISETIYKIYYSVNYFSEATASNNRLPTIRPLGLKYSLWLRRKIHLFPVKLQLGQP